MRDPAARWAGEIDGEAMTHQTGRDRIRMSVAEARALGDAADAVSGYLSSPSGLIASYRPTNMGARSAGAST